MLGRPYRKSPRLVGFDYVGALAAFLTLVTRKRTAFFQDPETVKTCLTALSRSSEKARAEIFAYCFMPDHLHLLVGLPNRVSMQEFVRHFKQLSGFEMKQRTGVSLWQTSYYDRILRREESIIDVARYIWENPVRSSLVSDWRDYQGSGPRELMEL
jgi:putative transposase